MNLERLLAAARDDDDDDASAMPLPEAMADTLLERYALLLTRHEFKPGDLVQPKVGVTRAKDKWHGQPMLVVDTDLAGYPPPQPYNDCGTIYRPDTVVLIIAFGDGVLRMEDSRMLEPWVSPSEAQS